MNKKATITIKLVPESKTKSNKELEKEILEELSKAPPKIPWMKQVLKVEVVNG